MVLSKDLLWKAIIEDLPEEFIRFFYSPYVDLIDFSRKVEFLDTELQRISRGLKKGKRIVDKLIKVYLKDGSIQWFVIHVEVQNYIDKAMDHRMFVYYYRIKDKYDKEVTAIAVLNYPETALEVGQFKSSFMGSEITYKYKTYNVVKEVNDNR